MAKINPMIHIDSMLGKYSKTDRVYTRVRKKDEATFGIALKHPTTNQPPTAAQSVAWEDFSAVTTLTKAELADSAKKAAHREAFDKQSRYKTIWGYVFHLMYEQYKEGGEG